VRRVRRNVPGLPQAILNRISAAIVLSAAVHVLLVYGFSLTEGTSTTKPSGIIQARLQPIPLSAPLRSIAQDTHPDLPTPQDAIPNVVASEPVSAAQPVAIPDVPVPEPQPSKDRDESSVIPDLVHYAASQLDVYPRALQTIAPAYPTGALETQTAGFVTLLVLIDEVGRVMGTTVVDATPDGVFEQAAQQALAEAIFYPAQREGHSVRSRILVKVEFDPSAAAAMH